MYLFHAFLLIKGVAIGLCQLDKLIFAPLGGSLNISCLVSSDSLNGTRNFSWFWKTWRYPETLEKVASCKQSNTSEKYTCKQEDTSPVLEIHNVSIPDSGVYYCAYFHKNNLMFGNGTSLIIGDSTSSNSPVVLLTASSLPPSNTIHLGCAVNVNYSITQWTWDVSGVGHKGKIVCRESSNGNWTCIKLLTLSSHLWYYGDVVTCEVWFNSSSIKVQWTIQKKAAEYSTICSYWLVLALTLGYLLLLLYIAYLAWTYRRHHHTFTSNERQETDGKPSGNITYADLNVHALTHGR